MTTSLEDWVLARARPPRLDILEQAQIPGARLDYSGLDARDAFPLLSQACEVKYGDFEALRFQVRETYGPRAHSAALTITRPDEIAIEFPNSGGHSDSTQAKAHAALRAVQEGALRFIFDDETVPVGRARPARLSEPARQRVDTHSTQDSAARSYNKHKKRAKRAGKNHGRKNAPAHVHPGPGTNLPPVLHSVAGNSPSVAQPKSPEGPPIKKLKTNHDVTQVEAPPAQAVAADTPSPDLQITCGPSDRRILIEVHAPAGSAQPGQPTVVQQRDLEPSGSIRCKITVTISE